MLRLRTAVVSAEACGLLTIAVALTTAGAAAACNLPVFRFALERWNKRDAGELYSLYVFNKGAWPDNIRGDLDALEKRLETPATLGNLLVYRIDVSKTIGDPSIAKIYEEHKKAHTGKTPLMVLRLPDVWGIDKPLHVGPLDFSVLEAWLYSPLRQKIARRALQGYSVVFLFLESGDAAKDEEKRAFVEKELARLKNEVKLPELTATPKDKVQREDIDLKVDFALLRLSRSDAAEQPLVRMLLGMDDEDYLAHTKEPVLIPIYGRGIAMVNEALSGKGINQGNLEKCVRFLLGPCSCEVRKGNPGIEMLMTVDWEGVPPPEPETVSPARRPSEGGDTPSGPAESRIWRNMVWVLGGAVVLVLLGSMLILTKRSPPAKGT